MKFVYVSRAKDILYDTDNRVYYMNDEGSYSEVRDIIETSSSIDTAYTVVCEDGIIAQVSSYYILLYVEPFSYM